MPRPNPSTPTAAEAAALLTEAWADADFGVLVMFAMTTGALRGETCALRWPQLDLDSGVAVFRASIGQIAGKRWEKDTKTHTVHRVTLDVTLDEDMVDVLHEHRSRCDERARSLDTKLRRDGFVFSAHPEHVLMTNPDTLTQRYGRWPRGSGSTRTCTACGTTRPRS